MEEETFEDEVLDEVDKILEEKEYERDLGIENFHMPHTSLFCDICLKNAHEKVEMKRIMVESTDEKGHWFKKLLCCPKCGYSREL